MQLMFSDETLSRFLSGLLIILILISIGTIIGWLLGKLRKKHPFSRLAIMLALPPLSFIQFISDNQRPAFYIFTMIVLVAGITIDGMAYLLTPKDRTDAEDPVTAGAKAETASEQPEDEPVSQTESSGALVWEKVAD